jgi:uncharacterized membrane protein YphA (DoxX/SURF4 family)
MSRISKITYWVSTLWLALGLVSTGVVQLLKVPEEVDNITELGYPIYLLTLLAIWKLLGAISILIPKFSLVKEWSYAGFFFLTTGAIFSHLAVGNPMIKIFPSILLLLLTITSWYFNRLKQNLPIIAQNH